MIADLLRANWQVFELLNQHAGREPLLDPLMVVSATDLIGLMPLLLLFLWCATARWSPVHRAGVTARERAWLEYDRTLGQRMVMLGGVAVGIALALNLLLGHLVYEPRPFVGHAALVHLLIAHPADNSFPSDHEAVAAAIATVFVLYLLVTLPAAFGLAVGRARNVRLAIELRRSFIPELVLVAVLAGLAVLAAFAIGLARVYTGVHYPGDILGGALCGGIGGLGAVALRPIAEPILAPLVRLAERMHLA